MYKVYGSQNEFLDGVTVFILRMRSLGQNRPLSMEHRICGRVNCLVAVRTEISACTQADKCLCIFLLPPSEGAMRCDVSYIRSIRVT